MYFCQKKSEGYLGCCEVLSTFRQSSFCYIQGYSIVTNLWIFLVNGHLRVVNYSVNFQAALIEFKYLNWKGL
jgi:hypothetical protein